MIKLEKDKVKTLLKTEMTLLEENTGIFGFEDSNGGIYFISFHREPDAEVIDWPVGEVSGRTPGRKENDPIRISAQSKPRLARIVRPVYPVGALQCGIQGKVIIGAIIDMKGSVKQVKVISGKPQLNRAAIDAVKQWRYQRHPSENKKQPIQFTTMVSFEAIKKSAALSEKNRVKPKNGSIPDIFPTKGHLTSTFGWRKNPFTGKKAHHNGIDIAAKLGTKVVATADGMVTVAEYRGKLEGNLIIIDHKNGYTTRYGRLSGFKVKKGDMVKKGQIIGFVGDTGRSIAPHLHYEIRLNRKPLNPLTMLDNKLN